MRLINHLTIRSRLIILACIALTVVVTTAIVGMTNNRNLSDEINLGYEAITRPLAAVANARGEFSVIRSALQDLARDFNSTEQNLRFKKQIMQSLINYERNITLYKEILDAYGTNDSYEAEAVDYLYEQLLPLREYVEYIVSIAEKTGYEADAVRILRGDFSDAAEDVSFELSALTDILEAQVNNANVKASRLYKDNNVIYVSIMIISTVILLLCAYLILVSITKPLKEMTSVAECLSKGRFDVQIEHHSNNELGILADSFRCLAQSITGIISDMQAMAHRQSAGDIEYFIDKDGYNGNYSDMITGINGMMLTALDDMKTVVHYLQNLAGGGANLEIKRFPGKKSIISDSIDELVSKVHFDMLTGIYNRRYMEENIKHIISTMQRCGGGPLSVLMIDVDFFKKFNDTYGHTEGDGCLRAVAKAIAGSLMRNDDFAARYGGEEFIVILPNTEESGALKIAERILNNVRALNIKHEENKALGYVTVSIGAATEDVNIALSSAEYVKHADEALYLSKQNGRNRLTVYGSDVTI